MADYMTRHVEFMETIRGNASYQASIADAIRAGFDMESTGYGQNRNFVLTGSDIEGFGPVGVKVPIGRTSLLSIISRDTKNVAEEVAVYAAASDQFGEEAQVPITGLVKFRRKHYFVCQDATLRGTKKLRQLSHDEERSIEQKYDTGIWKSPSEIFEIRESDNQLIFVDGKNPYPKAEKLAQKYIPRILENIVELK